MSYPAMAAAAAEETRDLPLNPYVVGAIAFLLLTLMMLSVLSFGRGREHT